MYGKKSLPMVLAAVCPLLLMPPPSPAEPGPAEPSRPNVLWIIAEDMGPELGCYGTPQVQTPVLDELAARGIRYSNAFTVTPVCSTSRSSFMTGMAAMSINAHHHRSHRDGKHPLPDGVRVLTDWLRPQGYTTANIKTLTHDPKLAKLHYGTGKTDWNFTYPADRTPFDLDDWQQLKDHQPFYAQVDFSETHRGTGWNQAHRRLSQLADPQKVQLPPYYPDHPVTRAVWAQYLNAVMVVDQKVGFILELLRRDGLDQNTIVVFMSDHGRAMPRGKQWPYDSGLHIPLLIYWPDHNPALPPPAGYRRGTVNHDLISSLDVTASTLDWAGVTKPDKMQGRVLFGSQAEEPRRYLFGGRDRGDETVFHIRTVRDERFRYLRNHYPERPFLQQNRYKEVSYPIIGLLRELHALQQLDGPPARLMAESREPEELYDLQADPWETTNLAGSPQYQEEKQRLSAALDGWLEQINDPGKIPEPEEVVAFWREKMQRNYDQRLKTRPPTWFAQHPALGPYRTRSFTQRFEDDFETGLTHWERFDPETCELHEDPDGNHTLAITQRASHYAPPHRSPGHLAMLKNHNVGDFDLEFRVRNLEDTGPHRDCCVFFGFQDSAHFYYVHLGANPDPHSGQIMVVDGAARTALTDNQRVTPWDDDWHSVRVERRLLDGTINVYFDNAEQPQLSVRDHRFGTGRVGLGSFDDKNEFDDVQLLW